MIEILKDVWCAILQIPFVLIGLLDIPVNLFIVALGAVISGLLLLLPDMPTAPQMPQGKFLEAVQWAFPLVEVAAFAATALTVFLGFMVVRIGLNWMRAI